MSPHMDTLTYLSHRVERLSRKYSHRPRYMAWRVMWVSFKALFKKGVPSIPPAQGILRDIQLASLKILQQLDIVCKKNGIVYWLDFGTLLGAVRHKGFIPWDDDIDVSMPRADYERFAALFNQQTQDPNLRAELFLNRKRASVILKIRRKDLPHVFVDIFPVDFCATRMDNKEKLAFTHQLKKLAHRPSFSAKEVPAPQKLYNQCLAEQYKLVKFQQNTQPQTVFYGTDFFHATHPYNAFDYETIFPLKEIPFEGHLFPCIAKTDAYLTQIYGNYKKLPHELHFHTLTVNIPSQEQQALHDYINPNK